jgi:hypothetical protein
LRTAVWTIGLAAIVAIFFQIWPWPVKVIIFDYYSVH